MDFFILFALLGLVALARVAVGLTAAPYGAIDWAAVRAQILTSLGAEAVASRARREEATKRRMAKRHRRWVRRQAVAADRAKALAAGRLARLAVRTAAKAAARAKSAAVAERNGHAALRAAAAVKAHRRLVAARKAAAAAGAVPCEGYGIKAAKRATRGSCCAANALKRAATLAARQEANTRKRAAAAEGQLAFEAQWAAKQAARRAAEKAAAEGRTRRAALADLLAKRDAVRLAHAVVRAKAKASRKEGFVQWLDENGHTCRGEAFVAANEAAWVAAKAEEGYQAHFGFSPEVIVAADKAAFERRAKVRAAKAKAKAARRQVAA